PGERAPLHFGATMKSTLKPTRLTAVLAAALAFGCSSDEHTNPGSPDGGNQPDGGGGSTGSGGSGSGGKAGSAGASTGGGGATVDAGGCDVTVEPSTNDLSTVQGALDTKVKSGNPLCFSPGTYKFKNHLTLSGAASVTFRGTGG